MEYGLALILLAAIVAAVVLGPLKNRGEPERVELLRIEELEAAKEAKYREIRDAELDYRTGKLSEADWRVLDRGLRAEAVEILRQLDELPTPAAEARS